jgi:hypothetical protein
MAQPYGIVVVAPTLVTVLIALRAVIALTGKSVSVDDMDAVYSLRATFGLAVVS